MEKNNQNLDNEPMQIGKSGGFDSCDQSSNLA